IGNSGGAFRRRRAEAVVLKRMARGDEASDAMRVSPSIVAAQGEQALRQGDATKAASFLARAAEAERDPEKAIAFAAKSAAAFIAAEDPLAASNRLSQTARKHARSKQAAKVMLQSAVLLAQSATQRNSMSQQELIEETLVEIIQIWPQSPSADNAHAWLAKILKNGGRSKDLADVTNEFLLLRRSATLVEQASDYQFALLTDLSTSQATDRLATFQEILTEVELQSPSAKAAVTESAIWLSDLPYLKRRFPLDPEFQRGLAPAVRLLSEIRTGETSPVETGLIEGLGEEWLGRLRWRLERDAVLAPEAQRRVASVLSKLPDSDAFQKSTIAFWGAPSASTAQDLISQATKSSRTREQLRRALEVITSVSSKELDSEIQEAIDRLAQTYEIGSREWYDTKIDACQRLIRMGRQEEAKKRANYILLTRSPTDEELKATLESIAKK
ncbi:MAG: hypothetical protein AAFV88_26200, partial [Planctomycetota bacterium]